MSAKMTEAEWRRVQELADAYTGRYTGPRHAVRGTPTTLPSGAAHSIHTAHTAPSQMNSKVQTPSQPPLEQSHRQSGYSMRSDRSGCKTPASPDAGRQTPPQPAPPQAYSEPYHAAGHDPLRASPTHRWGIAAAPNRLVDLEHRRAAFNMFDLDRKGLIWAFDLALALRAAGYELEDADAYTLLGSFGIAKGAGITLTQFHALCDYFEGVAAGDSRSPVTSPVASPRGVRHPREGLPQYRGFPGYQQGALYRPPPSVAESSSDAGESGVPFDAGDLPPPPQVQTPASPDVEGDAFACFDLDSSGTISVVDLPGAFLAAGFKRVMFSPHVTNLLRHCNLTGSQVTRNQFGMMCGILAQQGVKAFKR